MKIIHKMCAKSFVDKRGNVYLSLDFIASLMNSMVSWIYIIYSCDVFLQQSKATFDGIALLLEKVKRIKDVLNAKVEMHQDIKEMLSGDGGIANIKS